MREPSEYLRPDGRACREYLSHLYNLLQVCLVAFSPELLTRHRNPELAAGLAQAELMIEDVRMDCARRVAEAETSRQTAEDEAAQLRRALRNAVDELQRTVAEVRL